ncbi:carboxypeptidase-like regulatory domain-containing protein [Catalinimonas sp. 4WD22]|uniref:carboxypeptidase-like regulatory domain-containing protein n=1 Tax=Catalinimonas locisalis TaxID=3133978 RepID=UPI003101964E
MIRLFFFLLFLSAYTLHDANAQAEKRKVWGQISDAQRYEAIPIANISTSGQGTFTDLDGHFSLTIGMDDTLRISHISYYPYEVVMQEMEQDTLKVLLIPRVNTMQEVVIQGLPSEEKFKQDMIRLEAKPSIEEQQAQSNVNFARYYFLSGYVPQMNSDDNHDWYVAGPQDVTFFSSGPSGGLIRAFRNVNRSQGLFRPVRTNSSMPDSLWQNVQRQVKVASDSVTQDSLLSKEKE